MTSESMTDAISIPIVENATITEHFHQEQEIISPSNSSSFNWHDAFNRVVWHGGSSFDAWLTASSFQVAQVLLNLPYSFSQLGVASGIVFQLVYGAMGCWTSYLMTSLFVTYLNTIQREQHNQKTRQRYSIQWYEILDHLLGPWWKFSAMFFSGVYLFFTATVQLVACASSVYTLNNSLDKRSWTLILGPLVILTALLPTAHNYRLWSFFGVVMTTYTSWYLTISSIFHDKVEGVRHSAPIGYRSYFVGATNMLFLYGGDNLTIEFASAMWNPKRFQVIYVYAILYIFTIAIPSATAVYLRFGDIMLVHTNAFAVLPRSKFRDAAIVVMVIHQVFEIGMVALPFYIMSEKLLGLHNSKRYLLRLLARFPTCFLIWITAIMIPFFGPIDSIIGSLFASFSVFIIPCLAHMTFYRHSSARQETLEQPPGWVKGGWVTTYSINLGIILWITIAGVGLGGWSSVDSLVHQVHTFGFFTKCYQCNESRNAL